MLLTHEEEYKINSDDDSKAIMEEQKDNNSSPEAPVSLLEEPVRTAAVGEEYK